MTTTPLYCFSDASFKTPQNYTPAFGDYLLTQLRIPAERIFAVAKKPLR